MLGVAMWVSGLLIRAITDGSPQAVHPQSGLSYDYPVTTKVPGTTTPAALESYLQSDSGKSDLSVGRCCTTAGTTWRLFTA